MLIGKANNSDAINAPPITPKKLSKLKFAVPSRILKIILSAAKAHVNPGMPKTHEVNTAALYLPQKQDTINAPKPLHKNIITTQNIFPKLFVFFSEP
jgi:hypothetical protein